jgi:hypothetical protein
MFGHRETPLQGKALGRPEWSVCASPSTLQVKEKATWLRVSIMIVVPVLASGQQAYREGFCVTS